MGPRSNRYDRAVFGPAVVGWEYEYSNLTAMGEPGGLASGLELSVQLRGDWRHRSGDDAPKLYRPGSICHINPSESYATSFAATRYETGLQLGFIFYPDQHPSTRTLDGELRIPDGKALDDPGFVDMCRAMHEEAKRGRPIPEGQIADAVAAMVLRNAESTPSEPMALAKRALDREYRSPLYVRHLAEIAGMRGETFSRKFAARFGVTPVRYRLQLRLNEAALLSWTRPDLALTELAAAVGFDDPSYFFRAFRARFGMTPAQYGHRSAPAPR